MLSAQNGLLPSNGEEKKEPEVPEMDFDHLLSDHVGECGRYQLVLVMFLALAGIPCSFSTMEMVFLTLIPDHWCDVGTLSPSLQALNDSTLMRLTVPNASSNSSDYVPESCLMYHRDYSNASDEDIRRWMEQNTSAVDVISCHDWHFKPSKADDTIVTEFSLVCSRSVLIATSQSIHMAGVLAGTLISGVLADRFGRRPIYVIGFVGHFISRLVLAFSVHYSMYCVLRFFIALFSFLWYCSAYVMSMELIGPTWRVRFANLITLWWGIGCVLLAGLAYFVTDWSPLILAVTSSCVFFIPTIWIIPESPRWLYASKKTERADRIMKTMAKWNKTKLPEQFKINIPKAARRANECDLVRTPQMRKVSLVVFFLWFVSSFVYYGLTLASPSLGGNVYLNFSISSFMEILAVMFCVLFLDSPLGRMWTIRLVLILGASGLLLTLAVPKDGYVWLLMLTSIGKFAVSASFNIVYLLAAEMFPTVLRSLGLGMSSMWARVGGLIAPYVAYLGQNNTTIPILIFGGVCVAGTLSTFLLPETRGQTLPETVQDVEDRRKCKRRANNNLSNTNYDVIITNSDDVIT